ncbi:MAG: helix-turn-helix domain-containing protein [Cuniculiplasma sp.]
MYKAYRFRMYPNDDQMILIEKAYWIVQVCMESFS